MRVLYYSEIFCYKKDDVQFTKHLLQRDLLDNSESVCCLLQESCCIFRKASFARGLLSYAGSICCKNVAFFKSVRYWNQNVFVTRGLLFSSENACCKRVAFQFRRCLLQGLLYNLESVCLQQDCGTSVVLVTQCTHSSVVHCRGQTMDQIYIWSMGKTYWEKMFTNLKSLCRGKKQTGMMYGYVSSYLILRHI